MTRVFLAATCFFFFFLVSPKKQAPGENVLYMSVTFSCVYTHKNLCRPLGACITFSSATKTLITSRHKPNLGIRKRIRNSQQVGRQPNSARSRRCGKQTPKSLPTLDVIICWRRGALYIYKSNLLSDVYSSSSSQKENKEHPKSRNKKRISSI